MEKGRIREQTRQDLDRQELSHFSFKFSWKYLATFKKFPTCQIQSAAAVIIFTSALFIPVSKRFVRRSYLLKYLDGIIQFTWLKVKLEAMQKSITCFFPPVPRVSKQSAIGIPLTTWPPK